MKTALIGSVYYGTNPEELDLTLKSLVRDKEFADIFLGVDGEISNNIEDVIGRYSDFFESIIYCERNQGLAVMLNKLLELVLPNNTYSFIGRFDTDDIYYSGRIPLLIKAMETSKADICGSNARVIDELGVEIGKYKMPEFHSEILKSAYKQTLIIHPSVIMRRELFLMGLKYDINVGMNEDLALWYDALRLGATFYNAPVETMSFRMSKNTMARRSSWKKLLLEYRLKRNILILANELSVITSIKLLVISIAKYTLVKRIMYQRRFRDS